MTLFWLQMAGLYGYKWTSTMGETGGDLRKSFHFNMWLDKTRELTLDQWQKGVDRCEANLRQSGKTGDECWPPSYAEFLGFCDEESKGIYKVFPAVLPESAEYKSKRKRAAEKGIKRLNSIFDD